MNGVNKVWILAMICLLFVMFIPLSQVATKQQSQIVEKGEYSRIQYVTEDGVMTPEFIEGYYIVVRNSDTGKEDRNEVSEEKYQACVVGDVIDNVRK